MDEDLIFIICLIGYILMGIIIWFIHRTFFPDSYQKDIIEDCSEGIHFFWGIFLIVCILIGPFYLVWNGLLMLSDTIRKDLNKDEEE